MNLEESSLSYEEISKYIQDKGIKLDEEELRRNLEDNSIVYVGEEKLRGLLIYRFIPELKGHHIFFFGADTKEDKRQLMVRGLVSGCWPKSAKRRNKVILYKNTSKLIKQLLEI